MLSKIHNFISFGQLVRWSVTGTRFPPVEWLVVSITELLATTRVYATIEHLGLSRILVLIVMYRPHIWVGLLVKYHLEQSYPKSHRDTLLRNKFY